METANFFKFNNDNFKSLYITWYEFISSFFALLNMAPFPVATTSEMEQLEDSINLLKKELIQTAKETGLNSHETICCSQKLDELILLHQQQTFKNINNFDQKSCFEM